MPTDLKYLLFKFFLIGSLACVPFYESAAQDFQKCDLIFQIAGTSNFSNAISDSTMGNDSLSFVHVGIIDINNDNELTVIEASPEYGVTITPLKDFVESAPSLNGKPGIMVKRFISSLPVNDVLEKAKSHLGEPYDWWYLPENGKMYCSELVLDSFIDFSGNPVFQPKPMKFRDSNGNLPEFWVELFQKLDMGVPEGIPGSNPQDLSNDPQLMEIFRYF